MPSITAALADYAASRHGVLSTEELRTFGIGPSQTGALSTSGLLVPIFRGVYRLRSAPDTMTARSRAISLADSESFVTGRAGGQLWGVRRMGRIELIEVR